MDTFYFLPFRVRDDVDAESDGSEMIEWGQLKLIWEFN